MATTEKKYIQSVDRALTILSLVAEAGELRLSDISERAGLKCSTALGLIQTLEHRGFLAQVSSNRAYTLGMASFSLGLSFKRDGAVSKEIHSLLAHLVQAIQETAYFELKLGDRYYYYDVVESPQPLRVCPDQNNFVMLPSNSAVTKVFAGWKQGVRYATDLEEVTPGLNCFALPYVVEDQLFGCIALTGPATRFTADRMEETYHTCIAVAKDLGLYQHIKG